MRPQIRIMTCNVPKIDRFWVILRLCDATRKISEIDLYAENFLENENGVYFCNFI